MFELDLTLDDHDYYIEGHFDPGAPATRRGHPDTWAPADPGHLDIDVVTLVLPFTEIELMGTDLSAFVRRYKSQVRTALEETC